MILINFILMDGMIKVFDDFFFFFCALVVVSYSASSIENDGPTRGGFSTSMQRNFHDAWSECQFKFKVNEP